MKFSTALFLASASTVAAFAPTSISRASTSLNSILTKQTGRAALDPAVVNKYDALEFPPDKIMAEYVWVDADGNTRSKTRTLPAAKGESVDKLPKWNFDGSSTGQAPGDDSEVILKPQAIFKDPFRPRSDGVSNILVMCDTWTPAGEPLDTNTRAIGKLMFVLGSDWIGLFGYFWRSFMSTTNIPIRHFSFPRQIANPFFSSPNHSCKGIRR
jgi:glutamine synthetase